MIPTFDTDICGVTGVVLGGFGDFLYNFIAALQATIQRGIVLFSLQIDRIRNVVVIHH